MTMASIGQGLSEKLANLRMPTVAVIRGVCLGGGFELALACDYRIVVDGGDTQLGLPEVQLGLIPGWGGTQRLPRTVGLERALRVILQQHRLDAKESLAWGLADAIVSSQSEAFAVVERWIGPDVRRRRKRRRMGLPGATWRQRLVETTRFGRWFLFRGVERILRRRVPDDMPAPWEALRAIRLGLDQGMAAGLAYERQAIGMLSQTVACRNLVTLFFLLEKARKGELCPVSESKQGFAHRPIKRVGVVGAGTMGAGIAQLMLLKGFEVVVQEVNEGALAAGMSRLELLLQQAVARRLLPADEASRRLRTLGRTTSWEGFAGVDLVIEAAIEEMDVKRELFRQLEHITPAEALLVSNTSSLSVAEMQKGLNRPSRMGGLHFFNPVHKMRLVEVVRAPLTDDASIAALIRWAADLGKTPVVVADSPGFIVNRILFPYLNEAGELVAEGVPIESVDATMRRFGMLMGPLELLDQVGLDVAAHAARSMAGLFASRITPNPALDWMCQHGWLGRKSGRGFYRYDGNKKKANQEALAGLSTIVHKATAASSDEAREFALERLVCLSVNEAAACLAEGLAGGAEVIDLAMVLGSAWAPHRGGPLRYADERGAASIVHAMERLRKFMGSRFEPHRELRERAIDKKSFYESGPLTRAAS
jgi:3-hydroxyacyl-CoA dehydrogenase/enoyl-CoA hydratase/3-hydroxybutyryl-CoA epimerase